MNGFIPCKGCGAKINFVQTSTGKYMPVDAEPVHSDELKPTDMLMVGSEIKQVKNLARSSFGYTPHWSTCKRAERFRKNGKTTVS